MELWERQAAVAVNKARSLVRGEQNRLFREVKQSKGRDHRMDELDEVMGLLSQAKDHIDTHRVVLWEYQTPLPF